ncbi:MAG: hypothetical protein E6J90_50580, partial [Deltaproteobacteria bacterium]
MKWKLVFVVLVLGALAWPRPAAAEKVKTNQSTKLYSRAGEQSPVILKLKPGQAMTVLAKDGRWIKVRVSGRTGWIPRSKVDMPNDDEELARNTRRRPFVDGRSTRRGPGEGGPDDRVGADATGEADEPAGKPTRTAKSDDDDRPAGRGRKASSDDAPAGRKSTKDADGDDGDDDARGGKAKDGDGGDDAKEPARPMAHVAKATDVYNDPNSKSDISFTAQPRAALYVGEERGKWTFVENDEGEAGFVLTSKLDIEHPAGGPRSRAIDARARLGVAIIRQSVSTPGGMLTPPDNYTASSSSFTIALGASALVPYATRYWLGGEFAYDFDKAFPGISYMNKSTGFSYHNLNLRALAGYDLQRSNGMIAFARLGFHYDSFQVSDVANFAGNPAKIPNQII